MNSLKKGLLSKHQSSLLKNKGIKWGLSLLFILTWNLAIGQAPMFEWVTTLQYVPPQSPNLRFYNDITVDRWGNVYTTGSFKGTVDFDPGDGVFNLTGSISRNSVFIQKLDTDGNLIWAKAMTGSGYGSGTAIAVDNLGNVYTTGSYDDHIDFDPNEGVYSMHGNYYYGAPPSLFLVKLDLNGNFEWAIGAEGGNSSSGVIGKAITVDNFGDVYVLGDSKGDLIPLLVGTPAIPSPGLSWDNIILKFNTNGDLYWTKSIGGQGWEKGYSIAVDNIGNIFTTGSFEGTVDFDPGPSTSNITSTGGGYIQKLTPNGDLIWAKNIGANSSTTGRDIAIDNLGNIYSIGEFRGGTTLVFDSVHSLPAINYKSSFLQKLNTNGDVLWVKGTTGTHDIIQKKICLDDSDNIYITGEFRGTIDFDPGPNDFNLTAQGLEDVFIQKLDANGDFKWAKYIWIHTYSGGTGIAVDDSDNVYTTGHFKGTADFDPNATTNNVVAAGEQMFVLKLSQQRVVGHVFNDFNQDCIQDSTELNLAGRSILINPGNIITRTKTSGWGINSLPSGTYTATIDTLGAWSSTCPNPFSFTVVHPDSTLYLPPFGLVSTAPCATPDISIHAPFLRPGFSNQRIYVQACNQSSSSGFIPDAYIIIELDPLLSIESGSHLFYSIGYNQYKVFVDTIYPGFCVDLLFECELSTDAVLGQTLCMQAKLYPVDSCTLDDTPEPFPSGITPCLSSYDGSFLNIEAVCNNDSICFTIENEGNGDMSCFSQVRIYLDGQLLVIDSIQLVAGSQTKFTFPGDGRTWRLETDQHPLLIGNSHPSASIEACGSSGNGVADLINQLPHDDLDPINDIFCGIVTGSYDPNDKTGYPLGLGTTHDVVPNQELEYRIRFQNTGTDTAFTVVIRDTLSTDLDIFSVRSGVSSHSYSFKMYGPRVLEWSFNNIMLPDSNTNEIESHGFVVFKVKQNSNLPIGTLIENSASIYFDFNAPIFTNTYFHTIDTPSNYINWAGQQVLTDTACNEFTINNLNYTRSGTYWQPFQKNGLDSLYILDLVIYDMKIDLAQDQNRLTILNPDSTHTYQWLDCTNGNMIIDGAIETTYIPPSHGSYAVQVTREDCIDTSSCIDFVHPNPQNDLGVFVFPNPTSDIITISKGNSKEIEIRIFDNLGKLLISRKTQSPTVVIDSEILAAGIYYIHLCIEDKTAVQKIVKN